MINRKKRTYRWIFLCNSLCVGLILLSSLLGHSPAFASGNWWNTGRVDGYPESRFITALGYGSTLERAQKDAARNLSQQIDSNVKSHYSEESSRVGMSVNRQVKDAVSVSTHAKLYGIRNIRGRFVSSQGSYVAVVGVKIDDLARYLKGRINNYRSEISSLSSDLSESGNSMRQIKDLAGLIRNKEKASFLDRELSVITGKSPSNAFDVQNDLNLLESLLSKKMTVSISLTNGCGQSDRFVRHLAEQIQQEVVKMGLLVVPDGGHVMIKGTVTARPMPGYSRRYQFYTVNYSLSMQTPRGTVWGSVARDGRVGGLTSQQAELLAVRKVDEEGVRPLVQGLQSKLFLSQNDADFVAFPSQGPIVSGVQSSFSGHDCNDFRQDLKTVQVSTPSMTAASSGRNTSSPGGLSPGHSRIYFDSFPPNVEVYNETWVPSLPSGALGVAPFGYDFPGKTVKKNVVDNQGNLQTVTTIVPQVFLIRFHKDGFYDKLDQIIAVPGRTFHKKIILNPIN